MIWVMGEPCLERRILADAVFERLDLMHAVRREHDLAKSAHTKKDARILKLASELSATKSAAGDAQREFDAHVREHQCTE
jgi:hypothetical protein